MKKVLLFLLIFFSLFSLSALESHDIYYADTALLNSLLNNRGIAGEGLTDQEKRSLLYDAENIEEYRVDDSKSSTVSVEIINSDTLVSSASHVEMSGNVQLIVKSADKNYTLNADHISLSLEEGILSALGSVSLDGFEEASVSADVLTLYYDKDSINILNASTHTEKKNSDNKTIEIYSVGRSLESTAEGGAIYTDGFIASREKDPLSSISASSISLLPGSDLMIENAVLKIGRVPIFYFPFFFYPGSRMIGNPSFGFSSERGAFLNTTFELFGHSKRIESKEESSFLSLFSSSEDTSSYSPDGAYYSSSAEKSDLESWAEKTESYMVLMFDAYKSAGLHAGVDLSLNFFDKSLNISTLSGVALSFEEVGGSNFRYYSQNSIKYSDYGLDLLLNLPFYSDYLVLNTYMNRNTAFSLEPLFLQRSSFPSSFSTTALRSIERSFELSYTLPSSYTSKYLSSFSLDDFVISESYDYDGTDDTYVISSATLPSFSLKMTGAFFDTEKRVDKSSEEEEETEFDAFIAKSSLLHPLYLNEADRKRASDTYSFSLGYSLFESLERIKEYKRGDLYSESLDNVFSSYIDLSLDLSSYFSLYNKISSEIRYRENEKENDKSSKLDADLVNALTVSFPFVGIRYRLSTRLINYEKENGSEKIAYASFDKDSVLLHDIRLSKSFELSSWGTLTPAVTYTLYPLTSSLRPEISYRYEGLRLSFSYLFKDKEGRLESNDINAAFSLETTYFKTALDVLYESQDILTKGKLAPLSFDYIVTLSTEDEKYSISEEIEFDFDNMNFERIRTSVKIPYLSFSFDFSGRYDSVSISSLAVKAESGKQAFQFWKGRIYLSFNINMSLSVDALIPAASSFAFEPELVFSIAEFADLTFSFKSENNQFYKYFVDNKFSFSALWDDLLASFDFFGDGRRDTGFNLTEFEISFTHYMQDWALSLEYKSSIELYHNKYQFIPEFSIYLSWNTFPDLNVDEKWSNNGGIWQRK
ncbi:MAG TPA: hypothetical protein IAB12_01045 [Candidatus Ornithospirochaeta avicola]|uniref:LPS-assembly protein LptD n=1 Tax=Candidatus Ornithospirochaeta avicola TaxID=2840896 RepID=A0A9D1PTJ4_9SPIO|nr:hypothetical protein [Candidatus Ornithospirochaeta avicola]